MRLTTPRGTVIPLVHNRPQTGLEGKFSLEYAAATALLDPHSGFWAFDDEAVGRAEAQRLIHLTQVTLTAGKGVDGLLDGAVEVEVDFRDGRTVTGSLDQPPGSPKNRLRTRKCSPRSATVWTWARSTARRQPTSPGPAPLSCSAPTSPDTTPP